MIISQLREALGTLKGLVKHQKGLGRPVVAISRGRDGSWLSTTNYEASARVKLDFDSPVEALVLIPHLDAAISAFQASDEVQMEIEGQSLILASEKTRTKTLLVDDFEMPKFDGGPLVAEVETADLRCAWKAVVHSAGTEPSNNLALHCVHLSFDSDGMVASASDGRRIAEYKITTSEHKPARVSIPAANAPAQSAGKLRLHESGMKGDGVEVYWRKPEGGPVTLDMADKRRGAESVVSADCDRAELAALGTALDALPAVVRGISSGSSYKGGAEVRATFGKRLVCTSTTDAVELSAEATLAAPLSGGAEVEFRGFADQLAAILGSMSEPTIRFELVEVGGRAQAMVVTETGEGHTNTQLVMGVVDGAR